MINRITLLLFIGLAWGQDITIAVFDLQSNGLSKTYVRTLTSRLQSELVKAGGYRVVERSKIDEILKEQKFQTSGCVEECLIEVGQMLGANQVVLGSISKVGKMYTVSARLVNAETAEIVESADYDTNQNIEYLLTKGIKSIAYQLLAMKQPKERISLSKLIKHHKGKILTLATTLWLAWGWLPPT